LATANSKEILQHNIRNQIDKYNLHGTDTGSTPVQIAILTEKIQNLTRHALAHKKDKNSLRSFQMLVSKRARLMKYLKKSNLKLYKEILSDFDPLLNETAKIL
jgi:small subunit ribosomal protein S15